jgi:GT2 family glycosyltransferase/glycosyltransferase involved in cell wall biosynthesis
MRALLRVLRALPLLVFSPLLLLLPVVSLAILDAVWLVFGRKRPRADTAPSLAAATVVIPNWNGRELLEKYLPSVVQALSGNPQNEVVVVDNGSTDGSAEFVRRTFPNVKLLALERNLGFGGGSNAGFRAARNDIVVLLNSDMRVERGFLEPLLHSFTGAKVFAVACQIFFSDPEKLREETGLTQGWWQDGNLRVRHRIDEAVTGAYPCFYAGGGSSAFDRRKFLELGGFDGLLAPFYLEDTDLGYQAWKRGWQVLYQPRSIVYHEHRGTIAKNFEPGRIEAVLKKNFLLWTWKNIHSWRRLGAHFSFSFAGALLSLAFGDEPGRANLEGFWRALRQLPGALRSRWSARSLGLIGDTETFLRPMGGYFRDRFGTVDPEAARLSVVFVSPYPILPPVHGGGVFMYQTLRELARWCDVHVVALLDYAWQVPLNEEMRQFLASAEFLVRLPGRTAGGASILPHAVREFANEDLDWLIHRQLFTRNAHVLQLEYTPLSQYAGAYHRIASILFEHDVHFQSIARGLEHTVGMGAKAKSRFEYLRALRFEMRALARCDRVQLCTRENREFLESFEPSLAPKLQEGLRAGIDTSRYTFQPSGREPFTMLFLGSFRHGPNLTALDWFARKALPEIVKREPRARLLAVGSDPPPKHTYADYPSAVEMVGYVEDIREPLARCAVFVCPILSGSGVRVKLLEAFAAGIPVVSTRIGAEGLARKEGEFCWLADDPHDFADRVLRVFANAAEAEEMAARARAHVIAHWDMAAITRRLADSYRQAVREKAKTRL